LGQCHDGADRKAKTKMTDKPNISVEKRQTKLQANAEAISLTIAEADNLRLKLITTIKWALSLSPEFCWRGMDEVLSNSELERVLRAALNRLEDTQIAVKQEKQPT
jgi:hypothetical protein